MLEIVVKVVRAIFPHRVRGLVLRGGGTSVSPSAVFLRPLWPFRQHGRNVQLVCVRLCHRVVGLRIRQCVGQRLQLTWQLHRASNGRELKWQLRMAYQF